ncbi:outer membrane receptor for ferrienterochelin and colicins [Bernardetia litoralis DSM 6794]|uniref:Outer membrane receptor for ferrienterochelin and colicins n=1 Tax=Bernardetia litoralis (strain ATCC 23117 / DSM 6794 / NBRC 15988 / NCIMB 1366 / Fx l1 / Sio-4) TaxID=880071 RepID=I4AKA3_BERLS|nr:TonB-dependent receptor [Bernardetia litoralis]AFM04388.1 outer membrane receptor for ferrienterochelin and colicins [Bernardetia litoralis DSM 6794]
MMKHYILSLIAFVFACSVAFNSFGQGSTTAALSGVVKDKNGEELPGATVLAVHTPTGSQFGAVTTLSGNYTIVNMNVGGPYTITVQYVGFEDQKKENVYLSLGQTLRMNFDLSEDIITTGEVVITGNAELIDGEQTGAKTTVTQEQLNALPTIARDLTDFTRTTPQASVTGGGGITFAGQNNRYNSLMIDGAVNNDVFGLSSAGTNGGQAGISPISLDAIEQVQIVIAPFDVRQGGFSGGGVNAVTRSGTNKVEGSVYYLFRNEGLAGKTPTDDESFERQKLDDFSSYVTGFRVGAPLKKDKLFLFINGEIERRETPQPFNFNDYNGASSQAEIENLASQLQSKYGYDAGGFLDNTAEVESNKIFARLDWNISKNHKLTARHSYTQGDNLSRSRSSSGTINFGNNGVAFPTVTNSSALELKSRFGDNKSNSLIIGYTNVIDDRDPIGADFPRVRIDDGSSRIYFGSEAYSTANKLEQSTFTITDNFSIFKGKHTITIGTHNEFYSTYNLFVAQNYGEYQFASLEDFLNEEPSIGYSRSYSLVDDVTGDGSAAAAEFTGMQLGFYAQDEYAASEKLNITFGVRVDIPIFKDPTTNQGFNDSTLAKVQQYYPDLAGSVQSGQLWKTPLLVSPRLGFNYDVKGDRSLQIRGGVGIFTSRIPLVWPGGAYNNNGLTVGGVFSSGVDFRADPFNQYTAGDFGQTLSLPSGQMDLFVEDFKLPQVVRASLAVDKSLPWGMVGTLEGIYTKTLNNVLYYNVNVKPATRNFSGADNRPYYDRYDEVESDYTRIMVGDNTNKGYSYNITAQIQKPFDNGFMASLAYTYGQAKSMNDGLSSQNSSQWRYVQNVNGKNDLDLAYSNFDLGSRVVGMVSYRLDYLDHAATTISLFYNGQSGNRFSYIYNGQLANDDTGSSSTASDLIYVPANQSDIVFNPITRTVDGAEVVVTADQQWQAFDNYIKNDEYLNGRRGDYAERNGSRLPFVSTLDLRILQDFYIKTANGTKHNLQLSFDVFNFTNLINKDWGRMYFTYNENVTLVDFEGVNTVTNPDGSTSYIPTFQFGSISSSGEYQTITEAKDNYTIDDSGVNSSRWQMQIGVRYSF